MFSSKDEVLEKIEYWYNQYNQIVITHIAGLNCRQGVHFVFFDIEGYCCPIMFVCQDYVQKVNFKEAIKKGSINTIVLENMVENNPYSYERTYIFYHIIDIKHNKVMTYNDHSIGQYIMKSKDAESLAEIVYVLNYKITTKHLRKEVKEKLQEVENWRNHCNELSNKFTDYIVKAKDFNHKYELAKTKIIQLETQLANRPILSKDNRIKEYNEKLVFENNELKKEIRSLKWVLSKSKGEK
jgi:hypothetical protein